MSGFPQKKSCDIADLGQAKTSKLSMDDLGMNLDQQQVFFRFIRDFGDTKPVLLHMAILYMEHWKMVH